MACAITARGQVQYWKSNMRLWEHALEVTTDNDRAHLHLAVALSQQGKAGEAIAHYAEALRLRPNFALAHNNPGVALGRQGRVSESSMKLLDILKPL